MKKQTLLAFLLLATFFLQAQTGFIGTWEGKMNAGVELRMIFRISQDTTKNLLAMIDCPDQGIKDLKASSVQLKNDSLYLEISQFNAKYSGKLVNDSVMTGLFKQDIALPLNFKKVQKISERKRPQTPVPPFPYKSEDVTYMNADRSVTYGATITIPPGQGPFPAALLITGSGQQNRDEEIMAHKPFAVIADALTRNGFIVLRVDDRGMGKSTGDLLSATSRDFANDAIVSLQYLQSRIEADKNKIGLIGHSEGGMIAQMIAAERSDISLVIMLAAPGEKNVKLMSDQNEALLVKAGLSEDHIKAYLELYNNILNTVMSANKDSVTTSVRAVVNAWIAKTPANIVSATTRIHDDTSKENFIKQFVSQLNRPWFKYFLSYDPAPYIQKITAHVLALNGNKDIQVISATNLPGIETALKKGRAKSYKITELEGLNHLFQECTACTINEYGQLEETISPIVLDIIVKWMKKTL